MSTAIRPATEADIDVIKRIAVDTNMFGPDDVGFFDEMIGGFLDGSMLDHTWLVADDEGLVVAAAYVAPEPFADRMWNLYFLSVDPAHQGTEPALSSSSTSRSSSAGGAVTPRGC